MKTLTNTKAPALPARLTESQAEAAIRAKEVEIRARELELSSQFRTEQLEAEQLTWRAAQAAQARETKVVQARSKWSDRLDRWRTTWATVVAKVVPFLPLVLPQAMAVMGQYGWGVENLNQIGASPEDWARRIVAVLFAGALESLSLFQGYYASKALERRDSAAGLYLGAFLTSGVVAALNYSHYASTKDADKLDLFGLVSVPGPTATAVVFALFSFISPVLWRIHSRAVNRDKLKAAGEVDVRAVRLSMARKLWHPWRSIQVMFDATWEGVESPAEAIALWEARRAAKVAMKAERTEARKAERVEARKTPASPKKAVTAKHAVAALPAPVATPPPAPVQDVAAKFPAAWAAYDASARGGNALTQRALAREFLGNNRHHAREIIDTWKGMNP